MLDLPVREHTLASSKLMRKFHRAAVLMVASACLHRGEW
jgi:hypothetical protein